MYKGNKLTKVDNWWDWLQSTWGGGVIIVFPPLLCMFEIFHNEKFLSWFERVVHKQKKAGPLNSGCGWLKQLPLSSVNYSENSPSMEQLFKSTKTSGPGVICQIKCPCIPNIPNTSFRSDWPNKTCFHFSVEGWGLWTTASLQCASCLGVEAQIGTL